MTHRHVPTVIAGGDAAYDNWCVECGERITRDDVKSPWMTEEEAVALALEMKIEAELELDKEEEEALHPEWRCPPRE